MKKPRCRYKLYAINTPIFMKAIPPTLILFILITWFCAFSSAGKAQGGFTVKFNSPTNEGLGNFLENTNKEYIGYFSRYNSDTDIYDHFLNKIDNSGKLILSVRFVKPDTNCFFTDIIQINDEPVEYLLSGYGNALFKAGNVFDFFIKVDSNFNIIWEKTYFLCPPEINPIFENKQRLLKKKDSGYIFTTLYDNSGNNRLIFFELSENGDSLAYRAYAGDSAGSAVDDLYYNSDSSAYIVNLEDSHQVPFWGTAQMVTIDFDFNQTEVTYLPRWHEAMTSKLLPDGSIVSGGIYDGILLNPWQHLIQICALKYDTSLILTDSSYFTNPDDDIGKREGYYNSIDYHYPNSIFVAGTYDYDVGIWISHPSWIAIAKYDSDLNLLADKYIGGDAYYTLSNIVATSDGGALITATRYDYQTQDYEHDFYVIKLDSLDLLVGNNEHKSNDLVKNAIVYPNPGKNEFYLRTALKNKNFELVTLSGKIVFSKKIDQLITNIKVNAIKRGTYLWKIYDQQKVYETGKWVKQ